jgi:4a-hydroxytetrahydrobiopterin dehydratase
MKTYSAENSSEKLSGLPGWKFKNNALEKDFVFKNFREAISQMIRIAFICETMDHHPEWTNVYNKLNIKLSTHDAGGVTDKDFSLAVEIEKLHE